MGGYGDWHVNTYLLLLPKLLEGIWKRPSKDWCNLQNLWIFYWFMDIWLDSMVTRVTNSSILALKWTETNVFPHLTTPAFIFQLSSGFCEIPQIFFFYLWFLGSPVIQLGFSSVSSFKRLKTSDRGKINFQGGFTYLRSSPFASLLTE